MLQKVNEYGSEYDWDSSQKYINSTRNKFVISQHGFRSGRDALRAVAKKHIASHTRVLMPALSCETMVSPFQENGYLIIYYKLNKDCSADFEDIVTNTSNESILLYINYFGKLSLTNDQLLFLQNKFKNLVTIEDRTHDFFATRPNNSYIPDYSVCSIRKWLSIPDGGLLYTKINMQFEKKKDVSFADIRIKAMKAKSEYLKSDDVSIKELFRGKLVEANRILELDTYSYDMSRSSHEMLCFLDFERMYRKRIQNVRIMAECLQGIKAVNLIISKPERSTLYFPILVDKRDEIQKRLASKKIYCPIIWPLPKGAIGISQTADFISKHMLALPCDHRYNETDMIYICKILKEIVETC
jgi:hypothetical protein